MSEFSEDSRVKYPTIIHLVGMGYKYISSNTCAKSRELHEPYDPMTNILTEKFREAYLRLNPDSSDEDVMGHRTKRIEERTREKYGKRFIVSKLEWMRL